MKSFLLLGLWLSAASLTLGADTPQPLNYQGRIQVAGQNFDGLGQFKFALVNAAGDTTYWSNDGTSVHGSEPQAVVSVQVTKGLYSVLLGNPSGPVMTPLAPTVFASKEVYLRVWFNDGAHGFQHLQPDQRMGATAYSFSSGIADFLDELDSIQIVKMSDFALAKAELADAIEKGALAQKAALAALQESSVGIANRLQVAEENQSKLFDTISNMQKSDHDLAQAQIDLARDGVRQDAELAALRTELTTGLAALKVELQAAFQLQINSLSNRVSTLQTDLQNTTQDLLARIAALTPQLP